LITETNNASLIQKDKFS